jgi:hypothetical protein
MSVRAQARTLARLLCVASVVMTACKGFEEPRNLGVAPLADVDRSNGVGPDFVLQADVSIRAETDPSFRYPASIGARAGKVGARSPDIPVVLTEMRFDYHIAYFDSAGTITVSLTPPTGLRSEIASDSRSPTIWKNIAKIQFSTEASSPTVILNSGREVVVDDQFIEGLFGTKAQMSNREMTRIVTKAARARQLQSMVAPFLRIRHGRSLKRAGIGIRAAFNDSATYADTSASLESLWIQATEEFDIIARRTIRRPNGRGGRVRSMLIEVTNPRVAGIPSPIP